MKKIFVLYTLLIGFMLFGSLRVSGQLLLSESFSYKSGEKLSDNGWKAFLYKDFRPVTIADEGLWLYDITGNNNFGTTGDIYINFGNSIELDSNEGESLTKQFQNHAFDGNQYQLVFLMKVNHFSGIHSFITLGNDSTTYSISVKKESSNGFVLGVNDNKSFKYLPQEFAEDEVCLVHLMVLKNSIKLTIRQNTKGKNIISSVAEYTDLLKLNRKLDFIQLKQGSKTAQGSITLDMLNLGSINTTISCIPSDKTTLGSCYVNYQYDLPKLLTFKTVQNQYSTAINFGTSINPADSITLTAPNGFEFRESNSLSNLKYYSKKSFYTGNTNISKFGIDVRAFGIKEGKQEGYLKIESKGLEPAYIKLESTVLKQTIIKISPPQKPLFAIYDQPSLFDTLKVSASNIQAPLKLKFSKNDFEFVLSNKTFSDSLIISPSNTSIDTLVLFRIKPKNRDFSKMFVGMLSIYEEIEVSTIDNKVKTFVSGSNVSKPISIIDASKIFTFNYDAVNQRGYSVLGEVTASWGNDNFGYIQDNSGGIGSILIGLVKYQVGDSLIIGSTNFKYDNEHNGEIISGDGGIYKLAKSNRIKPRLLKYSEIKPEYTGTLVTIQNLKFEKTGSFKRDTLYSVTDGTNKYIVRVYQSDLIGSAIPNLFVNITGILTKRLDKWFLLPRNKTDIAISIKQARQTALAQTATVYGRITANNQFGATVFLQDATAGIAVFSDTLSKSVQVGDSVSVTGTTALFNGLFQLSGKVSFQKFAGSPKAIAPLPIKLSEMKSHEAELVSIKDLEVTDKKFVFVPNTNNAVTQFVKGSSSTIKDTTFLGEIRIVNTTNLIGRTKPQSAVNATGIVSQFNGLYQLQPRSQNDMPNTQVANRTTQGIAYDKTFDLVTWNTNWLGNKSNGPTNEPLQQANFKRVLDSLQADIFVFEEVSNQQFYRDFVAKYTNYKGFCSSTFSLGGVADDAQRVCFLYRKGVVDSVSARPLLKNATPLPNYPSDPARFWASGRLPFMFTADVNIDGVKKRVNIVGLHARANTSANTNTLAERELQYRQRRYDVEVLKDSLDKFYTNDNLFIVGDYNDDVDETVSVITSTKESSYKKYVDDAKNYQVITKALSDNGYRSYLSQNNVIDHIIVSNELTNTYLQNSVNVELPFMYLANYTTTTSDHIPVLARFQFIINAPSEMTANVIDYQGINLAWKDNTSDEKGFELERSVDNKTFIKISDVAANTTTFSDKKLEANKKYYYRVKAITSEGTSKYATAEATTAVILGEEAETQTFFKISPNPNNGLMNITLNDPTLNNAILSVSLMTIDGKTIVQTEGKLDEINVEINAILPKRAAGTYLIRLETKDRVGILKVVKE